MKGDSNGRYTKANKDGYNLNVYIPSIKILMYWILFIEIIFPWILIGAKFELLKILSYHLKDLCKPNR